jgi:WD40 repeat protein
VSTEILNLNNVENAIEIGQLGADYPGPVQVIAFSPDSTLLACSTYDNVYMWDVRSRRRRWSHKLTAQDLAFSPDGETLVVAGRDVVFFDLKGEQQAALKGHAGGTTCVAYSPDGTLLASGGKDGVVRVGNLETKRLAQKFDHPAPVQTLAFSPDGMLVAVISWDKKDDAPRQVTIWDVVTGAQVQTLSCNRERNLAFSPDGTLLAVDGKIFNIADKRVIYDFSENQIIFSPNGELMASSRNDFPSVGVRYVETGEQVMVLKGHNDPVRSIAFNADGTLLASGAGKLVSLMSDDSETGDVRVWGVPAAAVEATGEAPRARKPLKRLGADAEEDEEEGTLLKPVQDLFNRLSRD